RRVFGPSRSRSTQSIAEGSIDTRSWIDGTGTTCMPVSASHAAILRSPPSTSATRTVVIAFGTAAAGAGVGTGFGAARSLSRSPTVPATSALASRQSAANVVGLVAYADAPSSPANTRSLAEIDAE